MSTTHTNFERQRPKTPELSRRRLAGETIIIGWLVAIITTTMQTQIWDHQERLSGSIEQYNWSPIDDLPSMLILMPFGFILYSFGPPGWIFWLGFGSALWNRSRLFIPIALFGSILFGVFWPKHFVGMMGI